jgi:hypothetical protein
VTAATDRGALAVAVRRVNARWQRCGEPACPALRPLWLNLMRELHLAEMDGDGARAARLIRAWQAEAIRAVEEVTE